MLKKLFALALVSALGFSISAAQAQGFNHGDRGFNHSARHGQHVRHHHHQRHHGHRGHR